MDHSQLHNLYSMSHRTARQSTEFQPKLRDTYLLRRLPPSLRDFSFKSVIACLDSYHNTKGMIVDLTLLPIYTVLKGTCTSGICPTSEDGQLEAQSTLILSYSRFRVDHESQSRRIPLLPRYTTTCTPGVYETLRVWCRAHADDYRDLLYLQGKFIYLHAVRSVAFASASLNND